MLFGAPFSIYEVMCPLSSFKFSPIFFISVFSAFPLLSPLISISLVHSVHFLLICLNFVHSMEEYRIQVDHLDLTIELGDLIEQEK